MCSSQYWDRKQAYLQRNPTVDPIPSVGFGIRPIPQPLTIRMGLSGAPTKMIFLSFLLGAVMIENQMVSSPDMIKTMYICIHI